MDINTIKKRILEAKTVIDSSIINTPLFKSSYINDKYSAKVIFKCENFQRTGSFKFRGAYFNATKLIEEHGSLEFCGHSSGNFAQALALSAHLHHQSATLIMPKNAPKIKIEGVKRWNGNILFSDNSILAREQLLEEYMNQHAQAKSLHPSNEINMILGNATATLELLEESPALDQVIVPVGGGGLLAGTALAAHAFSSHTSVYGAEPSGAADALASFQKGVIQPSINPNTIADGLRSQLGNVNFPIIQEYVKDIKIVDDHEIIEAMKDIYTKLKIVIEPSSALPLAIIKKYPEVFANKRIGVIITGGNIDLINLAEIFK